jgi:chorismate dehydratase
MSTLPRPTRPDPIRVGAVTYLNAKPLIVSLAKLAPEVEIVFDVPSRLADALAAGQLDVAMIPSIEYARQTGCTVVSDACIACDGPVRSVKLYSRVPIEEIRSLALDEGSRTSAALARILLQEQFGLNPAICLLPLGASVDDVWADAMVLIGDRGMLPTGGDFTFVWDLGEQWSAWTGLPFVFAMWIARPGVDLQGLEQVLSAARDDGLTRLEEIARCEAPLLGISEADCLSYLRDHLKFRLGDRQRQALQRFYTLAERQGLAPAGVQLAFYHC